MSARVLVGRFGAAHGLRGEVRLQSFTGDPLAIASYGPLADAAGGVHRIESARLLRDDMLIARIAGARTREAAEALRGRELFVDRSVLPATDEEEFYHADLIGLIAEDVGGAALGRVAALPNFGGGALIEIALDAGGTLLLPFTKAVVPVVDVASGRVVVAPPADVEGETP